MNCRYCGAKVEGLEVHVLPQGYEQPTPQMFHQRCLTEYETDALLKNNEFERELKKVRAQLQAVTCQSCHGTGVEFTGTEYMGQSETVDCGLCYGTGLVSDGLDALVERFDVMEDERDEALAMIAKSLPTLEVIRKHPSAFGEDALRSVVSAIYSILTAEKSKQNSSSTKSEEQHG